MTPSLLAVVGARGGAGATTFSLALARSADAVLIDLDGLGGGLDAAVGAEAEPGLRWSGLRLAGGDLDLHTFVDALPRVCGVRLLAADRAPGPAAPEVAQLLDVLAARTTVVDLPRRLDDVTVEVLARCDLLVLVVPASISGAVAGHALAGAVPPAVVVGVVVRGAGVAPATVAAGVGRPLLGVAPDLASVSRAAAGVADGVVGR